MTTQNTGGPAYPAGSIRKSRPAHDPGADFRITDVVEPRNPGMTLRDYFAAKAMQAAATNPAGADGFTFEQRAQWAYGQADAMLKARES